MYKLVRGVVFLVIMLGVWLIILGLLGSLSAFTTDMVEIYQSSQNSLGFEDAVIVNPAQRTGEVPGRVPTGVLPSLTMPSETQTSLPWEGKITATPFLPITGPTPVASMPVESTAAPPTIQPQPTPTATSKPIGPPERIVISKVELDAAVVIIPQLELYLGEDIFMHWQAPDFYAAGWHTGSAFLGEKGNTVLSGHNTIYGGVFDRLAELQQGDEMFLYSGAQTYRYLVSQVMTFEERNATLEQRLENARWITPSEDERITLVSCWPPRSNSHRIMVIGTPVD